LQKKLGKGFVILYAICVMDHLTKDDLAQIDREYLQSLENGTVIDLACRLRDYCVKLVERLEQDSRNSSKPPSSDNPYDKDKDKKSGSDSNDDAEIVSAVEGDETEKVIPDESSSSGEPKRSAGRQPGSKGFWRSETPVPETTIPHYPDHCVICWNEIKLPEDTRPYMGHYVYDLEKTESGIRISCSLHHYYAGVCDCGHVTKAQPGEGFISHVEGRKQDLRLTEYTMVGPMLATFIAALSIRFRMSRVKINEFLSSWASTDLSVGTIDRCIREAGVACHPVVEDLVRELQEEEIVNVDETPWYEKGDLKWLWVAISTTIAVFYVGTRKKEELLNLVTSAFIGWLVTDGYLAYRSYERRQRCLAHLIRKAIALSGAVDKKAQQMGDWFLRELRGLIKAMADHGEGDKKQCNPILARLKRACKLGSEEEHPKLRALAREILNDWDAVVAFVKNPELPPTNNDAERALRHAVISRRISFGTRTTEGSRAYAALLSVVETCRLRNQDPWEYIAQTIALARKGIAPAKIPA
jgi:transposase